MAQKWYNKASVQVAMISTLGLVIITIITISFQRSDLKKEFNKLSDNYKSLEIRYDEAKSDRDKAEIRLAPFLATAERYFQDIPEGNRLQELYDKLGDVFLTLQTGDKLILGKLNSIENKMGSINENQLTTGDRVLPLSVKDEMTNKLKNISDWNVRITSIMGDVESQVFAEQLKSIFNDAGWQVNGVNQALYSKPVQKVIVEVSQPPPRMLEVALMPLFDQFKNPREAYLGKKLGKNTLSIIIGKK